MKTAKVGRRYFAVMRYRDASGVPSLAALSQIVAGRGIWLGSKNCIRLLARARERGSISRSDIVMARILGTGGVGIVAHDIRVTAIAMCQADLAMRPTRELGSETAGCVRHTAARLWTVLVSTASRSALRQWEFRHQPADSERD